MGLAIETVAGKAVNPSTTFTAATMATGDSLTVRSFAPTDRATLVHAVRKGTSTGAVRVRSPMFHDDVRGITFTTAESPAVFLMPQEVGQPLVSQDTLILELTGGTGETDVALLTTYYSNLLGQSARLVSWGDIAGMVKNIKPVVVAVTNSATIGAWQDTVITTTEDLLHANQDYAVLGYLSDTAFAGIGVRGQETGNLRNVGPGPNSTLDVTDYFVNMSMRYGGPCIPVFNSANKNSFYVSTVDSVASSTGNVQLILAELTRNLQ